MGIVLGSRYLFMEWTHTASGAHDILYGGMRPICEDSQVWLTSLELLVGETSIRDGRLESLRTPADRLDTIRSSRREEVGSCGSEAGSA